MKIVRFCLLLTMMFSIAPAQGQDTDSIRWYDRLSIGFGHDDVRNVDIGLLSGVPSLEGFQVGLIGGGARYMSGVGIYGIMGGSEEADGVQIAGINLVRKRMHGLAIGGLCFAGEGLHGVQIGGVNIACLEMKGVQVGFFNGGRNFGLQVGAVNFSGDNSGVSIGGMNIEFAKSKGLQVGMISFADSLSGVQIGFFNTCWGNVHGTQIGILNYCAAEEQGRQFGLVNINPHSRLQMLVTSGNHDLFSLALRIRNRHTYNVIGLGFGRKGWKDYSYGSAYYRIGQYFTILPRLTLSGDVGIADVAVLRKGTDAPNMFSLEARMNVEYEVHPKASLFATAGYTSTRYVSDGKLFKNKQLFELGVALF